MARVRTAYVAPPEKLVQGLVHPVEVAVYEFIDANYDDLLRRYTQARLKSRRGQPPSEQELQSLEAEAEKFMDDTLPGQILAAIDLDRIGYPKFIEQRLGDIFLSGIADKAMGGQSVPHAAADLTAVARRLAARKL